MRSLKNEGHGLPMITSRIGSRSFWLYQFSFLCLISFHSALLQTKVLQTNDYRSMKEVFKIAKYDESYISQAKVIAQNYISQNKIENTKDAMHCVSIFKLAKDPISAVNVLDHMESRQLGVDTFLYNNVISVCTKVGDERLALDLLLAMKTKGIPSDVISFSSVINAFAKRGKWKESLNLLKEMSIEGIHADTICYSSAISACATAGCWREALVLISTMKSNKVPLDTIVCNSAIIACGPSGEWTVALRLMELMKAEGLTPNAYSYAAAMTACDMGGQCDEVVSLLQRMVASMSPLPTLSASPVSQDMHQRPIYPRTLDVGTVSQGLHQRPTYHRTLDAHEVTVPFNVAITALMKCGRIQKAKDVFDQMGMLGVPKNTVTYTAFITGVTKSKHFDQRIVLDVHDEMMKKNLRRNEAIFGAVIAAAEKEGEWELALNLLEVMKVERIETTSFIYHSAISACGKADKYEEAVHLLEEMKQRKVERTCVTYSLMIGACKKGGRWEEALRFLTNMENDNNAGVRVDTDEGVSRPGGFLIANTLVYGAVISVCVESQQWGLALELLERMEVLGVQRNVVTYNTVIEALSNAGESARAELVYQSAVRTGIYNHWYKSTDVLKAQSASAAAAMDLHNFPVAVAKAAVMLVLGEMSTGMIPIADPLILITGRGNHANLDGRRGILRKELLTFCSDLGLDLLSDTDRYNEKSSVIINPGRLWLTKATMQKWLAVQLEENALMKSQGSAGAHGNMFLKVAMAKYKASQGVIVPVNVRAVCPFSKATRDATEISAEASDNGFTDRINGSNSESHIVTKDKDLMIDDNVSTLTSNNVSGMATCSHALKAMKVAEEEGPVAPNRNPEIEVTSVINGDVVEESIEPQESQSPLPPKGVCPANVISEDVIEESIESEAQGSPLPPKGVCPAKLIPYEILSSQESFVSVSQSSVSSDSAI